MEHSPAEHQHPEARHGSMAMYLTIGALSVILTIVAFYLVWQSVPLRPYLFPIVLVLAAIQVALQTMLFMHLNLGRRMYSLFFGFGMAMAIVIAFGVFGVTESLSPPPPLPATQIAQSTTQSAGGGNQNAGAGKGGGKGSTAGATSQAQLVTLGQSIINAKCEACHMVNGKGGKIGPDLNLVMQGKSLPGMAPGGQPTNKAWLARWIANPQQVWSKAIMPPLGLSQAQVQAVVAYLTTKVK